MQHQGWIVGVVWRRDIRVHVFSQEIENMRRAIDRAALKFPSSDILVKSAIAVLQNLSRCLRDDGNFSAARSIARRIFLDLL